MVAANSRKSSRKWTCGRLAVVPRFVRPNRYVVGRVDAGVLAIFSLGPIPGDGLGKELAFDGVPI
jgi:hypothetical protein